VTDRTVVVRLRAVTSDFTSAMNRAGQSTTKVAQGLGSGMREGAKGLQEVKTEATIAGAALVGIGVAAVAAAASFDKEMSGVAAVSGATADEMDRLRQAALDAGAATVFSASDAAKAQAELAKAGVSTSDILGGALTGSLDLAAAGNLDLAEAATIAAQAMNLFKLRGGDVTRIADTLAAGANKSAADVSQLGQALSQAGLVAAQTGLGLEDTVGTLSAFADRALIGSDAGTSLKTMLQRLVPQSDEAAEAMEALGISAFDASGEFVGMPALAGQLQTALGKLTPEARSSALAVIFGADAVRAANVLYELGADGVRDYTEAVSDQGAAGDVAAKQLDNLAGDLEALKGSIETALIQAGSGGNDALRALTQTATEAVNRIGALPAPVLGVGTAAITAAGGFLLLAPRVSDSIDAFQRMEKASPRTGKALTFAGKAAGKAAAAFVTLQVAAYAVEAFSDTAINSGRSVAELSRELKALETSSLRTSSRTFGDATDGVRGFNDVVRLAANPKPLDSLQASLFGTSSSLGAARASIDQANQSLAQMVNEGNVEGAAAAFESLRNEFIASGGNAEDFDRQFTGYRDAVANAGTAAAEATGPTVTFGGSLDGVTVSADTAEDAVDRLTTAMELLRGTVPDADKATSDLEEAIDAATAAAKENGKAVKNNRTELDLNAEAGRKNRDALDGIASAALEGVEAWAKNGDSAEQIAAKTERARAKFVETAIKMGLTSDAAEDLADDYGLIPEQVKTQVSLFGATAATTQVDTLASSLARLPNGRTVTVSVRTQGGVPLYAYVGGKQVPLADGGYVSGPGTSRSDSISAALSTGEFVVRAAAVERNRPVLEAMNNGYSLSAASFTGGGGGGFNVGQITVQAAPGEPAAESLPRALEREAFLLGFGG
jgi:TP901 family phage tail tape measure protein